jgi:hypothetical protein
VAVVILQPKAAPFRRTSWAAIVVGPIPGSATSNKYGALPTQGLVDTLAMETPVDFVGFGVQNFVNGGGPCGAHQGCSASLDA